MSFKHKIPLISSREHKGKDTTYQMVDQDTEQPLGYVVVRDGEEYPEAYDSDGNLVTEAILKRTMRRLAIEVDRGGKRR